PPGPSYLRDATYAEIHTFKDGKSETYRVDHGKIKSVGDNSITITERDGQDVTVPTSDATKVLGGPAQKLTLADLKAGQRVTVDRETGEPANTICVLPKMGQKPPPPPPGQGQGYGPPGGAS